MISLLRGRNITFSEFLEELDELGLKGKTFGPERYRHALEEYLGLRIEIIIVNDQDDSGVRRAFIAEGHTAVSWYRPERNFTQLFVLSSLSPLEMTASIHHELSHLAAGHLLRTVHLEQGSRAKARPHRKRLAKKAPPVGRRVCEKEAKIREEYCVLAGALGSDCLDSDDLRQVR